MGLRSFFKSIFGEDEELNALRRKHGVSAGGEGGKAGAKKVEQEDIPDMWEEIDNFRMNFFLGGWVTRKLRGAARRREDKKEGEGD